MPLLTGLPVAPQDNEVILFYKRDDDNYDDWGLHLFPITTPDWTYFSLPPELENPPPAAEYPPAGPHRQHAPARPRVLLAARREIRKLAQATRQPGTTLVPLKVYFVRGRAKLLLGVARGRRKADKRQKLDQKLVDSRQLLRRADSLDPEA